MQMNINLVTKLHSFEFHILILERPLVGGGGVGLGRGDGEVGGAGRGWGELGN